MTNQNKDRLSVLFVCIDHTLGGSTLSLFELIESIKPFINPIVLFPKYGFGYDLFIGHDIESVVFPFVRLHRFKKNRLTDVICHPWRWHYIAKWRADNKCVHYLKKILNDRKVDIVHSNTSPNDIGVLLARSFHARHVWHVREYVDAHFHFDIYGGLPRLKRLINQADARIAISTAIKDHWEMREKGTWVIHDAVRMKADACYYPNKDNYVLFVSYNLTEEKGTRLAIMAYAKSGVAKSDIRLKLMGNCKMEYKAVLLQTAYECGVKDDIDFIPCQADVKPWFAHATVYLMASQYEGFGRVTAEAMFFGCPIIAHASGGTLDIVEDGKTGYLFTSIDECASLLRKVCESDNESMILRAQEFAFKCFSQEEYGPRIMRVYNTVMDYHDEST